MTYCSTKLSGARFEARTVRCPRPCVRPSCLLTSRRMRMTEAERKPGLGREFPEKVRALNPRTGEKHPTSNVQHPTSNIQCMELGVIIGCWKFDVRCSMFPRFMGSLLGFMIMHWDHEPTPNPSQEGNFRGADGCLFPSWEGSGVGRFMERAWRTGGRDFSILFPRSGVPMFQRMNNPTFGFTKEDPWRIFRIMAEFVDSFEI